MLRLAVYVVRAPHEGDGSEDVVDWYFRTRGAAEQFARESADHEQINHDEGPYPVTELLVARTKYRKISFTMYE